MGQIYLNIKGREAPPTRLGTTERNGRTGPVLDYDRTCERVIEALQTLKTPNGRPMLDQVIRQSALSPGAHRDEGPDLHVILDGYRYISCPLFATDGNVISRQIRGDSGSHRMYGILIACGPHITRGASVTNARIVDLAPTVLHMLGCSIPDDMDGRVLTEILDASRELSPQPRHLAEPVHPVQEKERHVLSDDEEAELQARLKGFGYLG